MASLFKVMNEAEDIITDIALGAIFHDYGKVYVPRTILDNPYKLSAKEFAEIKTHSDRGHYALYDLVILNPVSLDIIRHHHEKIDGTGYPDGLSDEISKYARIASISDAFSALTTNRSYRKALPKEEALDIMYNQMKGAFDAFYLSMFASMLDEG
jgi:HD-GYP domain-containing protein (c-di-GMP phosphodiesterase class II)